MAEYITFNTISEVHQALSLAKPKHPLVTVVHNSEIPEEVDFQGVKVIMNLYQIVFKKGGCGTIHYGRNAYDYQEGTLLFTEPRQVIQYENERQTNDEPDEGWILGFHPDLALRSNLAEKLEAYSFFHYDANEALHLSDEERKTIEGILDKIVAEYSQNLDKHSQSLIATNIELLLDYCVRFYDRQFYTRSNLNSDFVSRFDRLLKAYYETNLMHDIGIPTVSYFANELNLTPSYLGDLIKKETGATAQDRIHQFIIHRAKKQLLNSTDAVSQIGYNLGFEYPQHFSNLFKAKTGMSPRAFRSQN